MKVNPLSLQNTFGEEVVLEGQNSKFISLGKIDGSQSRANRAFIPNVNLFKADVIFGSRVSSSD